MVNKFCYLGDMLSSYGGVAKAVSARIAIAWKTFRELSGLNWQTGSGTETRGEICRCYVLVLLYCPKSWELSVADDKSDVWYQTC